MNFNPVCFGSADGTSSKFTIKYDGTVSRIKLVHLSGSLFNCATNNPTSVLSRWGCYIPPANVITTVLTYPNGTVILPTQGMLVADMSWKTFLGYELPGVVSNNAPEISMNFLHDLKVTVGQQYGIWHSQDYLDISEINNAGSVCIDVYLFGIFA